MDKTILAIESSCDETAVAVIRNGRQVLSDVVYTQMELFRQFGGVVPEIASRKHVEYLQPCIKESLKEAGISFREIDAVGVTYGPGLVGALLTGVSCGKALSYALGVPLIGVNHIEGHICANYLTHPDFSPPFLCLIISGGHSHLIQVQDYDTYKRVGKTRDDAAGEVFDKVARVLGLSYPGGPAVEKLAESGEDIYHFPQALRGQEGYDFSFSGLKTAVINQVHGMEQRGESYRREDIAASFQDAVIRALVDNTMRACTDLKETKVALAGGVSCNGAIRRAMQVACDKNGMELYLPDKKWCTDNAAMIGCSAYYNWVNGEVKGLDLNASPALKIC